jgi:hypothetical protein
MLTVGQINEQISLLRSKIAVTEGIVLYLKTHYMPSDGGPAEMHFTRSDYGKVPPSHVERTIADYVEYLDSLKIELARLEDVPIAVPEDTPKLAAGQHAEPKKTPPKPQGPKAVAKPNGQLTKPQAHKEAPSGTARGSEDQPAVQQQAAGGKAG